ncbi:tetratricopeptide repeat protein [Fulvivirga ulvae]|uniref:tetratricopeptide repeat protein n=1 Tax=Fulvivirga ulvae TaxID=2904245 RepID=UPI001F2A1CB9|nr:tetratricopeptide repeat protein [Fulvivirga ulvae]UII32011.1 tetratricopeptide repeat protein [Fulvivirga ulvae]
MTYLNSTFCSFFFLLSTSLLGGHLSAEADTIDSLNNLAIQYSDSYQLSDALALAMTADSLSDKLNYREGGALSQLIMGAVLGRQNQYREALEHLEKSMAEYESLKDFKGMIRAINERGIIFWGIGEYDKYLEEHLESLELSQRINYEPGMIDSYISLGSTYGILRNFEEAVFYYERAQKLASGSDNFSKLAVVYNQMGKLYRDFDRYDSAEVYFHLSRGLAVEEHDVNSQARAIHSLGELYYRQGHYERALKNYFIAQKLLEEIDNKRAEAIISNSIGITYFKMNDSNSAIAHLKKGVEQGRTVGSISNESEAAELLSRIYQSKGNYEQALVYYQYFKELSDDINKSLRVSELARLEMQYQYDKEKQEVLFEKEQENLINLARIEEQKAWLYLLVGGVIILLLISVFIFVYHQLKQRTAKGLLLERQLKIEKLNNEMEELIYRTSHDLKAPIATILGITNLVSRTATPEQVPYFKMIEGTIRKQEKVIRDIADISKNENLRVVRERIDFEGLINDAVTTYKNGYDEIDIQINLDQKAIFYSDKERVKIVINNLISNAITFRDLHKAEGSWIKIAVESNEYECKLKVSDNGVGIDKAFQKRVYDMFFRGEELSTGSGLGLYVTKNIVQKLRGKIELDSEKKIGTSFMVLLPNLH